MVKLNWRKGPWRLWGVFAVVWWGFWVPAALTGVGIFQEVRHTREQEDAAVSGDGQVFWAALIFLLPLLLIAGSYVVAWAMRGFAVEVPTEEPTAWEKRPPLKVR
jgi:hypothetical protein